ncbi:huntingtin-like [Centruroides sculpturatus]|uniref:huntingtin-like n=1 Tax=Centruroides sculpturatus TaxID=218467 RepID=UPI000C6D5554|nr:huntingtin-like [Centruroides sculpturatus]
MATMERLIKAFDALKVIQSPSSSDDSSKRKDIPPTKKEKIAHCNTIVDTICSPNIRSVSDFPKFLGVAVETFLLFCDDNDSDVRLMAGECLNRTIKHLGRLQVELYKEIKKDGPSRSLRAALSRFADLCHLIRPQKCRPYTMNLLPCLIKISQRIEEEAVQETLAVAIGKIMPVLGKFTNDLEIKLLLKAFLPNLVSESAAIRRTAASILIHICQHSRKPTTFFVWLLSSLLEYVIPVQEEKPVHIILGVLLCLRHLIPHLSDQERQIVLKGSIGVRQKEENIGISVDQLLQVYELLLFYTHHNDHNVITATLEALHQLLHSPPKQLIPLLLDPVGISKSQIYTIDPDLKSRCASQGGMIPESTVEDEAALEDETELTNLQIEKGTCNLEDQVFADNPSQNYINEESCLSPEDEAEDGSEYSNVTVGSYSEGSSPVTLHKQSISVKSTFKLRKGLSDEKLLDEDFEKNGQWEFTSLSSSPGTKEDFKVENIGNFTDNEVPLKYCSRLLCSTFLLTGSPDGLIPDQKVRVSIKALALSCMSSILALYPESFFLPLHTFEDIPSMTDCQKIWEILKYSSHSDPHLKGHTALLLGIFQLISYLILADCQKIWEILKYSSHSDPHLKGHTALLLGIFIKFSLKKVGGSWDKWINEFNDLTAIPSLEELIEKLLDVIEDKSAVASKLGLTAVKHCLPIILESVYGYLGLKILDSLLLLKNNPYWLVKVEMVNIISVIPFKVVHFLESRKENNNNDGLTRRIDYQDRFLRYIFLPLLEDEDFRIRQAVAHAFVKMIPNMFFEIDHDYQDPIIALTKEKTMKYLNSVFQTAFNPGILPLVHALVMPFDQEKSVSYSVSTESALSRIINLLCCTLLTSVDKYLTFGCCQTLYYLTEEYIMTTYIEAWNITFGEDACIANHFSQVSKQQTPNSPAEKLKCHLESNILSHILSLVTDTHLALDLVAHKYILRLLGNLMSGACYQSLLQKGNSSKNSDEMYNEKWTLLKDRHLIPTFEQLFSHLLRKNKQHICKKFGLNANIMVWYIVLEKHSSIHGAVQKTDYKIWEPCDLDYDKSDTEKEKSSSKMLSNIGLFFSHPLYMKIYDMLKGAYSSYKISLDLQSGEKFTGLLQACLDTLSQLLEVANSKEMGKCAEEILSYLKSVLSIEACATVQCIRQLLKSLFGTNLASLWEEPQQLSSSSKKPGYATRLTSTIAPGLYHNCVTYPYTQFTHSIANSSTRPTSAEGEEIGSWLSWMRRRSEKKLNILLRSGNKGDKASLAAHIRLFETVVIKALKQYTVTSNINLQCQVLDLLAQLVQLRVNYCLLDSDQIFIGFVIKQFEYVEEGQIPCAELLIPKIFYFLVLLSYERYHSKVIIGVPKIIQLCDGLMASGQPPDKYAIPALQPIVEDLFLLRGSNKLDSGKELDTQKEVVVSMLLRLVHYPQVLDLFLAILHQSYKEGEDRWKKLSRQIVDIILPLLSKQQLHLDEQLHLDTLHRLFEAVAPSVFRPTDILLKALFTTPQKLTDAPNLNRWMCLILVVLRVLISQGKEEVVLSRLGDLGFVIAVPKYGTDLPVQFNHPLCAEDIMINFSPSENPSSPEETFARFLFQVAGILVKAIHEQTYTITSETNDLNFLCQQMAELLLYFMHMFQSGMFRHVANSAMTLIKQETKGIEDKNVHLYSIKEISQLFLDLAPVHPTVVLQWCNVLTLLNCDNQNFWTQILRPVFNKTVNSANTLHPNTTNDTLTMTSCNLEMVRKGGIILLCDYVCENLNDAEQMTWLIVNYVNDLIQLSTETPVQDFISAIHRNPAASGLFIQAIHARCENLTKPNFVKKTLRCLEAIHPSQSGSLLNLLINKFLPTYHLATARYCDSLACCRLELLLAETTETISSQLSVEDIEKLLSIIQSSQIYLQYFWNENIDFVKKTLRCLEAIHPSQSGSLLNLLINKFLPTYHLATARYCDSLACCRLELLLAETTETISSQLSVEDIEKLLSIIQSSQIYNRHRRLVSLLERIKILLKPESVPAETPLAIQTTKLKDVVVNKEWYLNWVREQCFSISPSLQECAQLLSKLSYEDALSVMTAKEFHIPVLEYCLELGIQITVASHAKGSPVINSRTVITESTECPMYIAAKTTLLQHITHLTGLLPQPHQAFLFHYNGNKQKLTKHHSQLIGIFSDNAFLDILFQLIPVVTYYLETLSQLPEHQEVPVDSLEDIARFSILSTEEFHIPVLEYCLELGIQITVASHAKGSPVINSRTVITESTECPMYIAAKTTLLQHITHLTGLLPQPHQAFLFHYNGNKQKLTKHHSQLIGIFSDNAFLDILFQLIPVVTYYLETLSQLPEHQEVPVDSLEDIARFSILSTEAISWMLESNQRISPEYQYLSMKIMEAALKDTNVSFVIGLSSHITWISSAVSSVYHLVKHYLLDLPVTIWWLHTFSIQQTFGQYRAISWMLESNQRISPEYQYLSMKIMEAALKDTNVSFVIGLSSHITWISSAVSSVYHLVKHYLLDLPVTIWWLHTFSIQQTFGQYRAISWMLESNQRISPEYQYLSMKIMEAALKDTNVSFVIGLSSHITWISSAVSSVYHLVKHLQRKEDLPSVPFQKFSQSDNNDDIVAQQACIQMSELVKWLEDNNGNIKGVSEFIAEPLKSVIIGLARLPLVNSFTRTPPILWQLGWTPELDGDYKTIVPPPPGEYLQERDVLKQYIYRVNLLGWTSRQQFEETWMALLGVLSATPLSTIEAREEDMERVRTSCLAVKSITSLLLRTLLLPQPGNPQNSTFLMQPRDKPLAFLHTRCGKKLTAVRNSIHKKLQEMLKLRNGEPNLSANIERIASPSSYFFSQVSVEYLCVAIGIIDDWEEPESSVSSSSSHFSGFVNGALTYHQREQCLSAVGLDIHSCLHFLLDLYSQWLSPEACPCTPLTLLTEVTRSVVILSDIFMERAQYEWMLDTLLEVQRVHPAEDEIITQYLIFGICKAAAVLSMEQDMLEKLKKLIELSLKSTFLPTRLATLYGLLHLLEQGSGEENSPLLSTASEYILKHLGNTSLPSSQNEDHILVMWAVAVYIIENYQEDVGDNEFGQKVFQIGINICNSSEDVTSNSMYLAVLLGLERLLLTEAVGIKEIEIIMKLSVDRLKYGSPLRALAGLGLLLSCMYVGKGTDLWPSELPPSVNNSATVDDCGNVATQTDPEQLIAAMERVTTLFDRIKRGFPFEVEAICNVLPLFLMEFFPAQDVMNKVIGEFLSSQQPHPQLLASVVFQVFQHLHQQSQEDIIYDWVMLSLSNFTQRSPIAMAVWSLTCFFVSASTLPWLQALFPHLQNRMGKMEKQDRKLFCIAGIQFKNQLKDDEHRKSFYSTIKVVAHPDSPYADLLSHL